MDFFSTGGCCGSVALPGPHATCPVNGAKGGCVVATAREGSSILGVAGMMGPAEPCLDLKTKNIMLTAQKCKQYFYTESADYSPTKLITLYLVQCDISEETTELVNFFHRLCDRYACLGLRAANLQWTPWDNCSYPAILDYPDPGFPSGEITVILAALCLIACCVTLARICDRYFLPAVEILVNRWGVKGDVVSAVVFASAASWPELAISVITVFDTRQAGVGIGTIVGTSVFNTLAVPAICAFSISRSSTLDIISTTRDTIMSAISLFLLGIVLSDNMVGWAESSIMLLLYIMYVFVLSAFAVPSEPELPKTHDPYENCHLLRTANTFYVQPLGTTGNGFEKIEQFEMAGINQRSAGPVSRCGQWAKSAIILVKDAFVWPLHNCLRLIIPPPTSFTYLVVLLGMVYIAAITYVIAWMITILGYKLSIPNSLLSLTILAVGLGYPDLISSLKAVKEGTASGALSNTLGANTFNILVCLGLPWLVCSLLTFSESEPPDNIAQPGQIYLDADGVTYSVNTMISALLMFYAALVANRFVLNAVVGYICIFIYVFFVLTMSLIEFNVFFPANKPLCNIKDYYNDPS